MLCSTFGVKIPKIHLKVQATLHVYLQKINWTKQTLLQLHKIVFFVINPNIEIGSSESQIGL